MADFRCLKQCRSPIACEAFGYCRERNFDGYPIDDLNNKRRKRESDAQAERTDDVG